MELKKVIHKWSWTMLVIFLLIGLIKPIVGVAVVICMVAPIIVSFVKGRFWCGNYCPRGSFNDIILGKFSKKLPIPKILKSKKVKILILIALMSGFIVQIFLTHGNLYAIGKVFVRMIFITTLISIILGSFFNQRTWCTICPMGTLAHIVAKLKFVNKRIPHVNFKEDKCINCNICSKNCPVEINVLEFNNYGKVNVGNCLKCNVCVDKCPKKSLHVA